MTISERVDTRSGGPPADGISLALLLDYARSSPACTVTVLRGCSVATQFVGNVRHDWDGGRPVIQHARDRKFRDFDAPYGIREILGILALAAKRGPAGLEDAAHTAVEIGVLTCRVLRKCGPASTHPLMLTQVDPLIRALPRPHRSEERRSAAIL